MIDTCQIIIVIIIIIITIIIIIIISLFEQGQYTIKH